MRLNPTTGIGNVTVFVTVNPTGLAPGVYTGSLEFVSGEAANSPQRVGVTLNVGIVPAIAERGIKNGASFAEGPEAPGGMVSIFGAKLASSTEPARGLPLLRTLGEAQVKVNGTPAPLFFASPTQINFQLPPELSGTSASIVVSREGVEGQAVSVSLQAASPGLFSVSADGKGPGAILKTDFSVVSSSNPATRGSVILLFGAGLGPLNPAIFAGWPAPDDRLSLMVLLRMSPSAGRRPRSCSPAWRPASCHSTSSTWKCGQA